MTGPYKIHISLLLGMILLSTLNTCKKPEKVIKVVTHNVSAQDIQFEQISIKGEIIDIGEGTARDHGIMTRKVESSSAGFTKISLGSTSREGEYIAIFENPEPGKEYEVKAYASDAGGDYYGKVVNFVSLSSSVPILTTKNVTGITASGALSGGNITNDGGSDIIARGICWAVNTNPTRSDSVVIDPNPGTGEWDNDLYNLLPATDYYVKAWAENSTGTGYGNEVLFKTPDTEPIVSTTGISDIGIFSARAGGIIISDGGLPVTEKGICYGKTQNPTTSDSTIVSDGTEEAFSVFLDNLETGTEYHVRAYATNENGTGYGEDISFITLSASTGTFTDARDDKEYKYIDIGSQRWMAENLAYLPYISPPDSVSEEKPFYYVFDYNSNDLAGARQAYNYQIYGTLYNWPAAMAGARSNDSNPGIIQGVCPDGWHIPSNSEWKVLEAELGMSSLDIEFIGSRGDIGGSLKSAGTMYWNDPNNGATNTSGFSALPGGYFVDGSFNSMGSSSSWWSSRELLSDASYAYYRAVHQENVEVTQKWAVKNLGYSVRCIEGQGINLAIVSTNVPSNISNFAATVGGNVPDDSHGFVAEKGVFIGQNPNPETSGIRIPMGTDIGVFEDAVSGLAPGTTYYVRAFATNNAGTSFGQVESFMTTSQTTGTFTDNRDGKEYGWVQIGSMKWMSENLAYLPLVNPSNDGDAFNPRYYVYDHQTTNVDEAKANGNYTTYGVLYNWVAAMDSAQSNDDNPGRIQGVCPDGWHLPSDSEWKALEMELGMSSTDADQTGQRGDISGLLKEAGYDHWSSPNLGADNSSGFTALPGGQRKFDGTFSGLTYEADWWTSTQQDVFFSYSRVVDYAFTSVYRTYPNQQSGLSVRCVEGQGIKLALVTSEPATNITHNSVDLNLYLDDDGGEQTDIGFYLGTDNDPVANGIKYPAGSNTTGNTALYNVTSLSESTTYYLRAYASNTAGTSFGDLLSFSTTSNIPSCPEQVTVSDTEGNSYATVLIGGQCWLRENLRSKQYSDGTDLTDGSGLSDIVGDNTSQYYFFYDDDESTYGDDYGALYTWPAAMNGMTSADAGVNGIQGICPVGWHLPDDAEWKILEASLGIGAAELGNTGWRGSDEGGKMKESGTTYWADPNEGATNESGFSARGAGYRGSIAGNYGYIQQYTDWWTATEAGSSEAYYRSVHNTETQIYRLPYPMHNGFSVRCVKNDFATVTTDAVTSVTQNTATSGGNVIDAGRGTVSERGVCWNTSGNPTTSDPHTSDGSGTGSYTSSVSGLNPTTTYYIRAYATTANGTVYGKEENFSTPAVTVPTLSTSATISNITHESAEASGELLGNGGGTITEMGLCWSINTGPTEADNNETTGSSPFTLTLTGLSPETVYYVRAYAINEAGTGYGNEVTFVTGSEPLTLLAYYPFNNNTLDESGNGADATNNGAIPTYDRFGNANSAMLFDDSYLNCNEIILPHDGNFTINMWIYPDSLAGTLWGQYISGTDNRTSSMLDSGTGRILFENSKGPSTSLTGSIASLETKNWYMATFIRQEENFILYLNGTLQGSVNIPSLAVLQTNLLIGTRDQAADLIWGFNGIIDDVRVYDGAMSEDEITTLYQENGWTGKLKVSDFDGNEYDVVNIGQQLWMQENLKTTRYSDGSALIDGTGAGDISGNFTTKYYFYNDDNSTNADTYGLLYSWAAVMNGSATSETNPSGVQGICPTDWHMPSEEEWKELEIYLGMHPDTTALTGWRGSDEGLKLKAANGWNTTGNGTNLTGFTGLPAGGRYSDGSYYILGDYSAMWSSTEATSISTSYAWYRCLYWDHQDVFRWSNYKSEGRSVRCLKD